MMCCSTGATGVVKEKEPVGVGLLCFQVSCVLACRRNGSVIGLFALLIV